MVKGAVYCSGMWHSLWISWRKCVEGFEWKCWMMFDHWHHSQRGFLLNCCTEQLSSHLMTIYYCRWVIIDNTLPLLLCGIVTQADWWQTFYRWSMISTAALNYVRCCLKLGTCYWICMQCCATVNQFCHIVVSVMFCAVPLMRICWCIVASTSSVMSVSLQ